VLSQHREALDALAAGLVARESLDGDEIRRMVDDAEGGVVRRLPAVSA
jgi:ATP-dependent Zn protease